MNILSIRIRSVSSLYDSGNWKLETFRFSERLDRYMLILSLLGICCFFSLRMQLDSILPQIHGPSLNIGDMRRGGDTSD